MKYLNYASEYSEAKFWNKLRKFAHKMGIKVVYYALLLYYVLMSPHLPWKARTEIIGALGYLILPVDLIPDFLPGGFSDDIAAIVFAFEQVSSYITPSIRSKAQAKVIELFGEFDFSEFAFA